MRYIYFLSDHLSLKREKSGLTDEYTKKYWFPSLMRICPPQTREARFVVWWLFHMLRIFGNRGYCVFLIFQDKRLVHRSCIFPRYFRFPFMKKGDLQIGDTWTVLDQRGKGLAVLALKDIVASFVSSSCRLWYVVGDKNASSIRVAEKAEFAKIGMGTRTIVAGIRMLGRFKLEKDNGTS